MKFQVVTYFTLSLAAGHASALPSNLGNLHASIKRQSPPSGFDAKDQFISTSGKHRWIAPDFAKGDIRGPCPGLNALANHGYLPRSGIATPLEFDKAIESVPRIGLIFSQILSFYGLETAGDGISWSIGGAFKSPIPGANPLGLDGTHNNYESDASVTRGGLYTAGNNYLMQMPLFKQLYFEKGGKVRPSLTLQVMSDHRYHRFLDSIKHNPYFFAGPIASELVSSAAHMFVYRLMGNKSEEFPEGQTTPEIFKTWFAVSGPDHNLKYTPGHERIPDNFYTRAKDNYYEVNLFAQDVAYFIKDHPITGSVGGNTGKTNSFVGIDIANATGGVFNAATLGEGNNAACFGLNIILVGSPSAIIKAVRPALNLLGCPELKGFDMSVFNKYPGYTRGKKDSSK